MATQDAHWRGWIQTEFGHVWRSLELVIQLSLPKSFAARHDPNPILHPVVFALKNHMRSLSQDQSQSEVLIKIACLKGYSFCSVSFPSFLACFVPLR